MGNKDQRTGARRLLASLAGIQELDPGPDHCYPLKVLLQAEKPPVFAGSYTKGPPMEESSEWIAAAQKDPLWRKGPALRGAALVLGGKGGKPKDKYLGITLRIPE